MITQAEITAAAKAMMDECGGYEPCVSNVDEMEKLAKVALEAAEKTKLAVKTHDPPPPGSD